MLRRWVLVVVIAGWSGSATGLGWAQRTTGPTDATWTAEAPRPRLELDPFRIESVGLTFFVPTGAAVETTTVARDASAQILAPDASWIINVRVHRTSRHATTLGEILDQTIESWTNSIAVRDDRGQVSRAFANLLRREPGTGEVLEIPNRGNPVPMERFYMALRDTLEQPATVRGFAVLGAGLGQFVTFELITTEADFPRARGSFEAIVEASEIRDPVAAARERQAVVLAGSRVLAGVTPEEWERIMRLPERWERIFRPGPSGRPEDAEEVGYRRIRTRVGTRGELESGRARAGGGGDQPGYLVRVDARFLHEGRAIDSQSTFFASADGQDEVWVVRMTDRSGGRPVTLTETGARGGSSLTVSIDQPGQPTRQIRPDIRAAGDRTGRPAEGYVPRALSMVLPQVLLASGVEADLGFYVYQSDAETVRLRRDTLTRLEDGWRLTTRLGEDRPPQVSVFTSTGQLVRTQMPDGTVWEPTTPEALMALWRRQGLPVD